MNCIGGPRQFNYKDAVKNGAIEKGIASLCAALWEKGATPLASCEGHPQKKGLLSYILPAFEPVKPYVLMNCSVDTARAMSIGIGKGMGRWTVYGSFSARADELRWTIEPIDIRYYRGDITRQEIDGDVSKLVEIINTI